jgi:hypothetical protein
LQSKSQVLAEHVDWAWPTAGQACPQVEQFLASVEVSVHAEPQSAVESGHVATHWKPPSTAAHLPVAPEQLRVHDPQCETMVRSASQPFSGLPSQSAKPGAHAEASKAHAPTLHAIVPET